MNQQHPQEDIKTGVEGYQTPPSALPKPPMYPLPYEQAVVYPETPGENHQVNVQLLSDCASSQVETRSSQDEEIENEEKEIRVKKGRRFLIIILCCCLCLIVTVGVFGCFFVSVGVSLKYRACVMGHESVETYRLDDSINFISIENFGDLEFVETENDFSIHLKVLMNGDPPGTPVDVEINPDDQRASFSLGGWSWGSYVCQGFSAVVYIPEHLSSNVTIALDNDYGEVRFEQIQKLQRISATKRNGRFILNDIQLLHSRQNNFWFEGVEFSSSNVEFLSSSVSYDSVCVYDSLSNSKKNEGGGAELKNWRVKNNGSLSISSCSDGRGGGGVKIDGLDVSGGTLYLVPHGDGGSQFAIDCQQGSFSDLMFKGYGAIYGGQVTQLENCGVTGDHPQWDIKADGHKATFKNIYSESSSSSSIEMTVSEMSYSEVNFHYVDTKSIKFNKMYDSEVNVVLMLESLIARGSQVDFEFRGQKSKFSVKDTTNMGEEEGLVRIDISKGDLLKGSVNEGGVQDGCYFGSTGPDGIQYSDIEVVFT